MEGGVRGNFLDVVEHKAARRGKPGEELLEVAPGKDRQGELAFRGEEGKGGFIAILPGGWARRYCAKAALSTGTLTRFFTQTSNRRLTRRLRSCCRMMTTGHSEMSSR
jgi:hypothetical protein